MNTPVLLLYHQIQDLPKSLDPFGISVTPENFAAQMHDLKAQGYTAYTLRDAVHKMHTGESLPAKSVVITFDDGYLDNYTHAWPILKEVGFPATIFLVPSYIGQSALWDGEHGAQLPLMDWSQIAEMESAGIEFGSHTHTHAALDTLPTDQIRDQLCTSKRVLDEKLQQPVETLAYPYEQFTAEVQSIAKDCGYHAACGTSKMAENPFNMWRVEIGKADTDINTFRWKLSSRHKQLAELKRRLRPIKRLLGR